MIVSSVLFLIVRDQTTSWSFALPVPTNEIPIDSDFRAFILTDRLGRILEKILLVSLSFSGGQLNPSLFSLKTDLEEEQLKQFFSRLKPGRLELIVFR